MQSCQFVKSVTERGSGMLCSVRPVAVSSAAFQRAVLPLQPQTVEDVGNDAQTSASASVTVLEHTMLFSHVLGLLSPILRQGDVTDSFCSVHFFPQVVEGSVFPRGTHVLPTTWWVVIYFLVSAGRVGVSPVLVKVDFHWCVFGSGR